MAGVSYLLLFIIDAFSSSITALIVFWAIPETKPDAINGAQTASIMKTLAGYRKVVKDKLFMAFIFAIIIIISVYTQMYSTLPVFLNRVHDVPAQGFGYMMAMNAAMVVLFQFWIIKRIKKYPPMLLMMIASIFYGIGYFLYGFTSATIMFFVGMAIITIGEMIHIPVAQALTAHFAPEDMRGRYMAAYGLGWATPNSAAPFLAGLVMDNYNPYWVWFIAGILAVVAIICFAFLQYKVKDRFDAAMQVDQNIL